ncbi:hypothetical protein EYF80_019250 [Liparis tanakae]|uniref:Uncharacterized protein n=1 Tax=Liparis tanakae TaxID=230148 RepID=A0A4Z2HYV4_9TELE|nr:hypothetical protein EYF80_019250 [Liparis tanakae]
MSMSDSSHELMETNVPDKHGPVVLQEHHHVTEGQVVAAVREDAELMNRIRERETCSNHSEDIQ